MRHRCSVLLRNWARSIDWTDSPVQVAGCLHVALHQKAICKTDRKSLFCIEINIDFQIEKRLLYLAGSLC